MRFDLFDAMAILNKEFGHRAELQIMNSALGILVRISFLGTHKTQFMIPHHEVNDNNVEIMNRKFNRAVQQLKHFVDSKATNKTSELLEKADE